MHNAYANEGMEWSGFNNKLARKQAPSATKSVTVYLFGPLIDAAPAHQDTVLTSMLYMKKSLLDLDMQYANLSVDMQLYMVGQQIKWWRPQTSRDVVLRPGAMDIITCVVLGMYRDTDEGFRSGCLNWTSIRLGTGLTIS